MAEGAENYLPQRRRGAEKTPKRDNFTDLTDQNGYYTKPPFEFLD
jgi:hypothetical protein